MTVFLCSEYSLTAAWCSYTELWIFQSLWLNKYSQTLLKAYFNIWTLIWVWWWKGDRKRYFHTLLLCFCITAIVEEIICQKKSRKYQLFITEVYKLSIVACALAFILYLKEHQWNALKLIRLVLVLAFVDADFHSAYIILQSDFIYSLSQILTFYRTIGIYDPVEIKKAICIMIDSRLTLFS